MVGLFYQPSIIRFNANSRYKEWYDQQNDDDNSINRRESSTCISSTSTNNGEITKVTADNDCRIYDEHHNVIGYTQTPTTLAGYEGQNLYSSSVINYLASQSGCFFLILGNGVVIVGGNGNLSWVLPEVIVKAKPIKAGTESKTVYMNRGTIISCINGTAAYGGGATIDMGIVIDATGNEKSYFTIGVTAGFGAAAGSGVSITNKNFRVDDIKGEAINGNFTVPILKGVFSIDLFGDSHKLDGKGWPAGNTRGGGLNVGVGAGAFFNWTYTFLGPPARIHNPYMFFSTIH